MSRSNSNGFNVLKDRLREDVAKAFSRLRAELKIQLEIEEELEINQEFARESIANGIIYKSDYLLDTALNYFMKYGEAALAGSNSKLKNKFYETDFRKRIKNWTNEIPNNLKLNPEKIIFSKDLSQKKALLASGITLITVGSVFTIGSFITGSFFVISSFITGPIVFGGVFVPILTIQAITAGFITILFTVAAYKYVYKREKLKARQDKRDDIERFFQKAEFQVKAWLDSVCDAFEKDFERFCIENNSKSKGSWDGL